MSYSGTVRCGWCGNRGHNRSSCSQRKEYINKNPDSWAAKREREAAFNRKARGRRCSYCSKSGHNAATCETKKADKKLLVQKLCNSRSEILDAMAENGFGIGALMEIGQGWSDKRHLVMITAIDWINTDQIEDVHISYCIPDRPSKMYFYRRNLTNKLHVLSKAPSESILKAAPVDWRFGTLYKEERYFPKGDRRQYWHFHD